MGSTSTTRLLEHDMARSRQYTFNPALASQELNPQALIAKSATQIATTASQIVILAAISSLTNTSTTSLVKPSTSRLAETISVPRTMKGRRRPKREVDLSATAPTMGWTMRPEMGPATQTREVLDFVRPRFRR